MPIYKYVVIEGDGEEGEVFEVEQSVSSPILRVHPENGKKVRRVYEAPSLPTQYTQGIEKKLSETNYIKSKGFEVLKKDPISNKYYKL